MLAGMRNANVKIIGLATLLLSLAACGGHQEASEPRVAAIPGATQSARAGSGSDVDRQLRLDSTDEEIARANDAYYACWTQHGVPSAPGPQGGPLLSYKKNEKKYQPAVDACADKEPLDPPELDPHQNPDFADDLRNELKCDQSHGLPMEIRGADTDHPEIWVAGAGSGGVDGDAASETKANLAKADSEAGREIQRQCRISAFTQK
jgi:hypothetical protein